MGDTGEHLDANRGKALLALLACDTVAAAARRAGRGQATLYRYFAESDFKAAYRAARAEPWSGAPAQGCSATA